MTALYLLDRQQIADLFPDNPRARAVFEQLQNRVAEVDQIVTANVAGTDGLIAASYVTLSPNAELPNEYVLAKSRQRLARATKSAWLRALRRGSLFTSAQRWVCKWIKRSPCVTATVASISTSTVHSISCLKMYARELIASVRTGQA